MFQDIAKLKTAFKIKFLQYLCLCDPYRTMANIEDLWRQSDEIIWMILYFLNKIYITLYMF